MATDASGLDPLSVSMREYIDGHRDTHENIHQQEHIGTKDRVKEAEKLFFQALDALQKRLDVLENIYKGNRTEDQHKVEVALEAVGKASKIHAEAHDQQHQAHKEIHDVEKENLGKASTALDKRLGSMNDFRDQLRDQAGKFVDRELDVAQNSAVQKQIDQNRDDVAQLRLLIATKVNRDENKVEFQGDNRAQMTLRNGTIGMMIAAATLVLSIVVIVVNVLLV